MRGFADKGRFPGYADKALVWGLARRELLFEIAPVIKKPGLYYWSALAYTACSLDGFLGIIYKLTLLIHSLL